MCMRAKGMNRGGRGMACCIGNVQEGGEWMVTSRDHWTDLEAMGFKKQEGLYDTRIEAKETIAECEGKEDPIFHELNGVEGLQVEDIIQMEFCTPEEARCFYNSYSRLKGFATRQGKKVPNKAGEIVRHTFVCNRQGFCDKKWLEMADRKREHKVVTRCGCLAEMRIKRKDGSGKWYVSRFLDNHNHELVARKYVDYLRLHRGLSDVEIAHLTSLREVGISIPKIYQSFAAQVGGFNLVRFTKQDMYNEVRKQKNLQNGNVNTAIRYLEDKVCYSGY